MKNERIIKKQNRTIEKHKKSIAMKDAQIKELSQKLAEKTKLEIRKDLATTQDTVKKNQKFNVGIWLLTSSFAIASCIFGLVNLILNLTRK